MSSDEAASTLPISQPPYFGLTRDAPAPRFTSPPENLGPLYAALVTAQLAAKAVGKDATNAFHHYRYASAEAIIEEARGALSGAGLAVFTLSWAFEPEALPDGTKAPAGDFGFYGEMRVRYRLVHGSGASLDCEVTTPVLPEKGRPQDKAQAASLTYSLGYFLRGLLLLPREDEDTSVDKRDDRQQAPRREQAPARPPQQRPAPMAKPAQGTAGLSGQHVSSDKAQTVDHAAFGKHSVTFAEKLDLLMSVDDESVRVRSMGILLAEASSVHDLDDVAKALSTFSADARAQMRGPWAARAKELHEQAKGAVGKITERVRDYRAEADALKERIAKKPEGADGKKLRAEIKAWTVDVPPEVGLEVANLYAMIYAPAKVDAGAQT